jgi:magnesium transporter
MRRLFRGGQGQVALPPGTMEYMGEPKVESVRISLMQYDAEGWHEAEVADVHEALSLLDGPGTTWINIDGLHETGVLETIGKRLGLHPLVLEDIVNTHQRPKQEDYQDYIYLVLKMLDYDEAKRHVIGEQISLVLGPNYVLSFQERVGDIFDPVRERIRKGKGRIRTAGPPYLAYALLDAVVDNYFVLLERIGDTMEDLEEDLVENPTTGLMQHIHALKREMIILRKAVWPTREVVSGLERADTPLIGHEIAHFLRDVYDHTIQVVDAVESFRDMLSGYQDLYLSSLSNKMNEVMKVLTIAATIFVPLTFVAGVYGMNFEYMPELHWKWSYLVFWIVILILAGGMLRFFRRRDWL